MKTLSRLDIAQRTDRRTGAVTLRYVGRGLRWENTLYGQPEGVFFVLDGRDLPLPDHLGPLAEQIGLLLNDHPDVAALRTLAVEAIAAEAWVEAPTLLAELSKPEAKWLDSDRLALERKHAQALALLRDRIDLIEADLRRRHLPARAETAKVVAEPAAPPVAEPVEVGAALEKRVRDAVKIARESELPQRMPGRSRRSLDAPGAYLVRGEQIDRYEAISAAMAKGSACDAIVIDWDGEWPVVVRRYEGGRVVYRVEDAIRRAGLGREEVAA